MAKNPIEPPKPRKLCDDDHPLKYFNRPKLRLKGEDFIEGINLICDVCTQPIQNLSKGYMTCEDACNFDIHTGCYDTVKDIDLACLSKKVMKKRQAGFKKFTQTEANESE